jgi:hypothetical protein
VFREEMSEVSIGEERRTQSLLSPAPGSAPSVAEESAASDHDDHFEEEFSRQSTPGLDDECRSNKPGSRVKGPWSREEDDLLASLVAKHGAKKWSVIAEFVPGRIGKQCRERWLNHLDTSVKKTPWTEEEDNILLETQRKIGNRWCEIARMLPGRPENAVKNRYNSLVNKGKLPSESRSRSPECISEVSMSPERTVVTPVALTSRPVSAILEHPRNGSLEILGRPVHLLTPVQASKPKEPALTVGKRFLVSLGSAEFVCSTTIGATMPLKKRIALDKSFFGPARYDSLAESKD